MLPSLPPGALAYQCDANVSAALSDWFRGGGEPAFRRFSLIPCVAVSCQRPTSARERILRSCRVVLGERANTRSLPHPFTTLLLSLPPLRVIPDGKVADRAKCRLLR